MFKSKFYYFLFFFILINGCKQKKIKKPHRKNITKKIYKKINSKKRNAQVFIQKIYPNEMENKLNEFNINENIDQLNKYIESLEKEITQKKENLLKMQNIKIEKTKELEKYKKKDDKISDEKKSEDINILSETTKKISDEENNEASKINSENNDDNDEDENDIE